MSTLLGIDLGGTKIEAAMFDPERLDQPLARLRLPTDAGRGYEHIVGQIARLCEMVSEKSGAPLPDRIGMGTPGVIDPRSGHLKNSNTQCLNGRPLKAEVEAAVGREFVLANDANCFALAEATLGCAKGYPTVFGVILGTGVGGGVVVAERVLEGCHGIAGEWGQVIIEPGGPVSNYGTRGTIESILCGPALERFYKQESGEDRRLKDIAERARSGEDAAAAATLDRLIQYFAKAIAVVIDVLDPHAIVLGGGVGNIDELYLPRTRDAIAAEMFNPTFDAALLKPTLGDSAGVFGAAMLVA